MPVSVTVGDLELAATWLDENPATRTALTRAMPIDGDADRWGDELYVRVPVETSPARTTSTVEPGTIAYWPAGPALCLFWGPTPASTDDTPTAASPVAPVARVDDVSPLDTIDGAAPLRVDVD